MIEKYNVRQVIKDSFVELFESIVGTDDSLIVTRDGDPSAVIIDYDHWMAMVEALKERRVGRSGRD